MRILSFLFVPLLATAIIGGCKDGGPTSSAHAATRSSMSPTSDANTALIPAAGGVAVQVLSRVRLPDDIDATFRIKLHNATDVVHVNDPSDVIVAKITVQPGGSFGWHTHHGPAIVTLATGELTIVHADDCAVQRYTAGQGFVDSGQGHVHVGFNASTDSTVAYVTFLDVPPGQGPTIPAQSPSCQL